jgi:sporulation protein YlmC with PRC-barrel domain
MTRMADLKGLKVVDKDGTFIGRIKDIDINMIAMKVQALVVHKGFFKGETTVMIEYIDRIVKDTLFLKTSVVTKLIGKTVVDCDGKTIGKIKDVVRVGETNVLSAIVVSAKVITKPDVVEIDIERGHPVPGEKRPMVSSRSAVEGLFTAPSGEVEVVMPISTTRTVKKDLTISAKHIKTIGDKIYLKVGVQDLLE